MSYCRWSSDNWRCDVYVYETCEGAWQTHVAARRRSVQPVPNLPWSIGTALLRWSGAKWSNETRSVAYTHQCRALFTRAWFRFCAFWHNRVHLLSLELIPLQPIGLPHDGESFLDATPGECADRLEGLKALGYSVPQYVIDELREEAASPAQEGK